MSNEEEAAAPLNPRLLRRRDTVYEDILGAMLAALEDSIKKRVKLSTVLEHEEHRRVRLPYQLFKKYLNKVIHEVHFTNGFAKFDRDLTHSHSVPRLYEVPCIGVDKNNLDCGENIILDIDSESTKLPIFCKMMIVNQGKVHERSAPILLRDVCLQIGESFTEKLIRNKHAHNTSLNASVFEDPNASFTTPRLHAIEDPNVSFTTPKTTHRARRPSWCQMEEYYSIPFYQYKGREKKFDSKESNTYVSMGYPVEEFDSLYSSFNSNNKDNNTNVTNYTNKDDLSDKNREDIKPQLISPISLNNTKETTQSTATTITAPTKYDNIIIKVDTVKNFDDNNKISIDLPSLNRPSKRKRNKFIHLVFNDQYTNTASIPVTPLSLKTDYSLSPRVNIVNNNNSNNNVDKNDSVLTVVMPGTPRDISIRYDEDDNDEIYYVKDGTTDTNDLINYIKLDELPNLNLNINDIKHNNDGLLTKDDNNYPFKTYITPDLMPKKVDITNFIRPKKHYVSIENNEKPVIIESNSTNSMNSNSKTSSTSIGRLLRQRYYKKTTGKDPMRFDEYVPTYMKYKIEDANFVQSENDLLLKNQSDSARQFENARIITNPDVMHIEQQQSEEFQAGISPNVLQSTPNTRDRHTRRHQKYIIQVEEPPNVYVNRNYQQQQFNNNEYAQSPKNNFNSPQTINSNDYEREYEIGKLINYMDKSRNDYIKVTSSVKPQYSHAISDALSISTIEPGENIMIDTNINVNNSFDIEAYSPNEVLIRAKQRGTSAYPDYSRYPLIAKALNRINNKNSNDLNRSVPTYYPRAHSSDTATYVLRADSQFNNENIQKHNNEIYKIDYTIQPVENSYERHRLHKNKRQHISVPVHQNDNLIENDHSYCPLCAREKVQLENQEILNELNDRNNNVVINEPLEDLSRVELENRIANLVAAENENTDYLIKNFINLENDRLLTTRSLPVQPIIRSARFNAAIEQPQNLDMPATDRIEKYRNIRPQGGNYPKYYRIRHDRTLKFYTEPIPVDVLRQNFHDLSAVTAAAAQSLTESGFLLKHMNNLLASAEI